MSLIQNSGNHCLHYPIAPTFFNFRNSNIFCKCAKLWIFLYYYLQQILSW
jgi:hypothetical protein